VDEPIESANVEKQSITVEYGQVQPSVKLPGELSDPARPSTIMVVDVEAQPPVEVPVELTEPAIPSAVVEPSKSYFFEMIRKHL